METTTQTNIRFTNAALNELNTLMQAPDFDNKMMLRVGVKGGGCSGLSYVLGFDQQEEDDEIYETQGVQYLMKKAHGLYLAGMEIDFGTGLNARGFIFKNPNASSSCGCGTSFAV